MGIARLSVVALAICSAQLLDSCRLRLGTNLSGLYDWGTEIPFVDLMKMCRPWYTKAVNDANYEFDPHQAQYL
ncbi:MAG: hypothetical protein ABDH91_08985 [Bacteroidia bacterium]